MSADEVAALGPGLASRMSREQLAEAALLFSSISISTTAHLLVPIPAVRLVFMNHLGRCIRMPAGGATAGGSQQTGFEMELMTADAATLMFGSWPNFESSHQGRKLSWELRSMTELADKLALEQTGWGALCGKPRPIAPGTTTHAGVILVGPPFTISFTTRSDSTTSLSVRFPLVLWSEEDAVIMPPDTIGDGEQSTPFYIDPPNQPGKHRDMFKTWGRKVAAELLMREFPMSPAVRSHIPAEYQSDCSSEDAAMTSRSVSPIRPDRPWDSSDEEGAHRPRSPDSSDLEGAHL